MTHRMKHVDKRVALWIGVAAVFVLPLITAQGAFDCFMKVEGVSGESTDAQHQDWIEVLSYSHGVSQPSGGISSSGGARSASRADHEDFSVVKLLDKATPSLNLYCCNGRHIPKVEIELARVSDSKVYYKITLTDVIVTAVKPSGDAEGTRDRPIEEVRFNYGKIQWTYTHVGGGSGGQDVRYEALWDVTQNQGD